MIPDIRYISIESDIPLGPPLK